jgi:FtsZ-binding cell division protein ZapB
MVNLEQIKLLETKVAKAIEHLQRLTRENSLLREQEGGLKKRIDELETEAKHYKENQSRIEAGIVSALERLDQFEDTMVTLAGKKTDPRPDEVRPAGPRTSSEGLSEGQAPDRAAKGPVAAPAQGPAVASGAAVGPAASSTVGSTQAHGKKGSMLRSAGEISPEEESAAEPPPDERNSDQLDIF